MKLLYTTQDRVLLYLLKSRLEENSINSFFKNEQPPLAGEIPPMLAWPQLWVMEDNDFAKATQCLNEELANRTETKNAWQCPKCHEKLEGQFEICWNCGYARS